MTAPEPPPRSPYNRGVLGGLAFIVYNVIGIAMAASAARTPLAGLMRSLWMLGNVILPVLALMKGWGRFAAGWAITIGVVIVALAGLCFYALGNMH